MNAARRILVVDDTEASRYAIARLLRREGYTVDEATDGAACLAALRGADRPDLLVLDIQLPDVNGVELCWRIKSDPATASLLVLQTSAAFTRAQDRAIGLDSGADGYLVQPIDPVELTATIRSLLRVRDAEERLRRSNEELEMFAHAAAHDLREPLRTMASYVQLMQRRYGPQLDAKATEWLGHIENGSLRMAKLIDMLLRFADVDAARDELGEVALASVVADVAAALAVPVREAGAAIEATGLPVVHGDAMQLAQVLQNLVANAIKFRRPGVPPVVRIAATERADDWLVTVADNGIGIPAEHRGKIFRRFQRLHTAREFAGTGLGLALCAKIVERHGGRMWVDAGADCGSVFSFTLAKPREPRPRAT